METSVKIFCCYAREDQVWLNKLKRHLLPLQRQGCIALWDDTEIKPGQVWEAEVTSHLKKADLILLLVSPDFLASDYCMNREVQQAIPQQRQGQAQIIPIILRASGWQTTELGNLQALPKDGKPIVMWSDQDEAFQNVVNGIRMALTQRNMGGGIIPPVPYAPLPVNIPSARQQSRITPIRLWVIICNLIGLIGFFGYIWTSDRSSMVAITTMLVLLSDIFLLGSWIYTLVDTARLGYWGWFLLEIFLLPFSILTYVFFVPTVPRKAFSQRSLIKTPLT